MRAAPRYCRPYVNAETAGGASAFLLRGERWLRLSSSRWDPRMGDKHRGARANQRYRLQRSLAPLVSPAILDSTHVPTHTQHPGLRRANRAFPGEPVRAIQPLPTDLPPPSTQTDPSSVRAHTIAATPPRHDAAPQPCRAKTNTPRRPRRTSRGWPSTCRTSSTRCARAASRGSQRSTTTRTPAGSMRSRGPGRSTCELAPSPAVGLYLTRPGCRVTAGMGAYCCSARASI